MLAIVCPVINRRGGGWGNLEMETMLGHRNRDDATVVNIQVSPPFVYNYETEMKLDLDKSSIILHLPGLLPILSRHF